MRLPASRRVNPVRGGRERERHVPKANVCRNQLKGRAGAGGRFYAVVRTGPLVHSCPPSVDVLFKWIILTEMGADGAQGLLELKQAGAVALAQNEATCIVYGMPKEAARIGAVGRVLPLEGIAPAVLEFLGGNRQIASATAASSRPASESLKTA